MSALSEKYKRLLIALLPKGKLWQPDDQPVFNSLLDAQSQEFCRVDERTQKMKREVDPRTTDETLEDWETAFGLPDACTPDTQTVDERKAVLIQKMTTVGGLGKAYYEDVITRLGYTGTVKNWVNFVAGRARAGDPLTNYFDRHFVAGSVAGTRLAEPGWRYYFNVEVEASEEEHFVAGSLAGEPLAFSGNELVQCNIRELKPAHAGVTFSFT